MQVGLGHCVNNVLALIINKVLLEVLALVASYAKKI